MTRDALRDALAAHARRLAPWALVPIAYLALRETLAMATRENGLITPEGTVSPGLVLLAVVVMALAARDALRRAGGDRVPARRRFVAVDRVTPR